MQRRAASRFSLSTLAVVALSSAMLFGCSAGDDPVEGAGQPPLTSAAETRDREVGRRVGTGGSETSIAATSTSAQTAEDDATSDQGSADADSSDGSTSVASEPEEGDHEDDFGMSTAELEELERALDEIDQLIADLELDLAAD